jgi:Ca-activated chloride channel family protein
MKMLALLTALGWSSLWFTPDQLGARLFARGDYAAAAGAFQDPLWTGVAWYRAGEFDKAAQAFALRDSAEANYNQGNARLMLGDYAAAIACYERALRQRPGWTAALENRAIASARRREHPGDDMGDQRVGADEIVFDARKKDAGQQTETTGSTAVSDAAIQELWLRRVQTRPADFLRAKFAYQQSLRESVPPP